MITLSHTKVQPILSKSQNFVIIEYDATLSVLPSTLSDIISVKLPDIRLIGLTYCPRLSSVKTITESADYVINFAETPGKLLLEDYVLQVVDINSTYYETDMNIFCNTHNDEHEILLTIANNDITAINTLMLRLVFEVFQYTNLQNP